MAKNFFADISVTKKLMISLLIVSVTMLLFGGILLSGFFKERLTAAFLDSVNTLSATLETGTQSSLERGQMKNFKKLLDEQKNIKGVLDISLYDREGKRNLSSSNNGASEMTLGVDTLRSLATDKKPLREFGGNSIRILSPQVVTSDCVRCHPGWSEGELGGVMSLTYDTAELTGNIDAFKKSIAVGGLVLLLLTSVIVFIIAKTITRPLLKMTEAMAELAADNLEVEIPAQGRGDEIGKMSAAVKIFQLNAHEKKRLAESIHSMADSFESSIGGIISSLTVAGRELHHSAETMSTAALDTEQHSGEAAASSESTATSVTAVSEATGKLARAVDEIFEQINASAKIVREASAKAETTNAMVASLNEASQQISDVTQLISDIAGQTDLLALNATIEAARAGDIGKGFAVVANEVKELSKQTKGATQQIGSKIDDIKAAMANVIDALTSFKEIIGRLDGVSASIDSAVKQQAAITDAIGASARDAENKTRDVVSGITVINEAAGNTGRAANKLLENAEELSRQSDILKEEMDKFLNQVRSIS